MPICREFLKAANDLNKPVVQFRSHKVDQNCWCRTCQPEVLGCPETHDTHCGCATGGDYKRLRERQAADGIYEHWTNLPPESQSPIDGKALKRSGFWKAIRHSLRPNTRRPIVRRLVRRRHL